MPTYATHPSDAPVTRSAVETLLQALLPDIRDHTGRGRPPIIPAAMLWSAMLVCILRQDGSLRGIWRLISATGFWHWSRRDVSDDAIYHRLERQGPSLMADLFETITATLWQTGLQDTRLASFARAVVALDESTLDRMVRKGAHRHTHPGHTALLPGKLSAVFDLRRQQFWKIRLHDDVAENEKIAARQMVDGLPIGSLILADLGYFGFAWFDDLTAQGHFWVARWRGATSTEEVHRYWGTDEAGESLVWLGAYRADQARYAVRLLCVPHGATVHRYLTNVLDPHQLSMHEVADLYARRWDIEQAFKVLKTDLGLATIWSTKWPVIQAQVWAMLIIAQVAAHLRWQLAEAAQCPLADISLPVLLRVTPELVARGENPVAVLSHAKYTGGVIRPSRRRPLVCPTVPEITPIPVELVREREPRYARKTRKRTTSPGIHPPVISRAPTYPTLTSN
ncbi:MAG TPA: IS4 family transposase [Thermomicrobiales bacterium]|nr:IS4 family transposase [Thermomicrobiales bacterium]